MCQKLKIEFGATFIVHIYRVSTFLDLGLTTCTANEHNFFYMYVTISTVQLMLLTILNELLENGYTFERDTHFWVVCLLIIQK